MSAGAAAATEAGHALAPLVEAVAALASASGIGLGARAIQAGDADALLPPEIASLTSRRGNARRDSGAARIVARRLLAAFGPGGTAIPVSTSGVPIWPAGIVGSLAHDDTIAVAAVAAASEVAMLGVDVEPAVPLPADMVSLVALPGEASRSAVPDSLRSRLLFSAKEAAFKATFPVSSRFLDFHDVEIAPDAGRARVKAGPAQEELQLEIRFCTAAGHIVTLAFARRERTTGR